MPRIYPTDWTPRPRPEPPAYAEFGVAPAQKAPLKNMVQAYVDAAGRPFNDVELVPIVTQFALTLPTPQHVTGAQALNFLAWVEQTRPGPPPVEFEPGEELTP